MTRGPVQWHHDADPTWPEPAGPPRWLRRVHDLVATWPLLLLLGLWVLAGLVEGGTPLRTVGKVAAAAVGVLLFGAWLAGAFTEGDR